MLSASNSLSIFDLGVLAFSRELKSHMTVREKIDVNNFYLQNQRRENSFEAISLWGQ